MEKNKRQQIKKTPKRDSVRPTIAYVAAEAFEDYTTMALWSGIVAEAEELDVNLIGIIGGNIPSHLNIKTERGQANVLYMLVSPLVCDGIISWASSLQFSGNQNELLTDEQLTSLHTRYQPLPIVTLSKPVLDYPVFMIDNYEGMKVVIRHLLEVHKYHKLAFIRGPEEHPVAKARYLAYLDILNEYGIKPDPVLVAPPVTFAERNGTEAINLFFDQRGLRPHEDIEAIIAASDIFVLTALKAMQKKSIRIPEDVALVGINNSIQAQCAIPSLTSVSIPFDEQVKQAMHALKRMLAHEPIPKQVLISPRIAIHESCGCLRKEILGPEAISDKDLTNIPDLKKQREAVIREMSDVLNHNVPEKKDNRLFRLFDAFITSLESGNIFAFISVLREEIQLFAAVPQDILLWQDVLTVLEHAATTHLDPRYIIQLMRQARITIGELTYRKKINLEFENANQTEKLRTLSQTLITTFDIEQLMEELFKGLHELHIASAYVALYENPHTYHYPQPAPEWSKMIMAYNELGRISLPPGGLRFPSSQIIPREMLPKNRRYTLTLQALYFKDTQIGFVIFEVGPHEWSMYKILRAEISSALQGALLVKQVQENANEIIRQKNILDTFIETVPDRIWFKDLLGRFTRMNKAHMCRLALQVSGEGEGKTETEIRGVEIGQKILEDEQMIIQTGKPLLNKEVHIPKPGGGEDWSLVTKMPLQDENGKIIGTFGISRDITELKQTQQALEQANREINKLNEELKDDNLRMRTEMKVARQIQTFLLPLHVKHLHPDFEIAAYMLPAKEVGGDYYDITLTPQNELWLNIGDVSGHGVAAGLIMMMTQTIHTTIINSYQAEARDVAIIANRVLFENVRRRMNDDHFMTFTALRYLDNGHFQFAGAHLPLIIYRRELKHSELIFTPGMWLNLLPDITEHTKNTDLTLAIGDILILYTDGLTEACNPATNKYLEVEGLQKIIDKHATEDVDALRDVIIHELLSWCDGIQHDDMTLVVVRRIK
jgi:PAS domain S-box-containing protein